MIRKKINKFKVLIIKKMKTNLKEIKMILFKVKIKIKIRKIMIVKININNF
jgi:hypothetical protein